MGRHRTAAACACSQCAVDGGSCLHSGCGKLQGCGLQMHCTGLSQLTEGEHVSDKRGHRPAQLGSSHTSTYSTQAVRGLGRVWVADEHGVLADTLPLVGLRAEVHKEVMQREAEAAVATASSGDMGHAMLEVYIHTTCLTQQGGRCWPVQEFAYR